MKSLSAMKTQELTHGLRNIVKEGTELQLVKAHRKVMLDTTRIGESVREKQY